MPRIISIDELEEGMVLQNSITNSYGQVLVNAGVTLEERHKKILKTWNISTIVIKADDMIENEEISEEIYAQAKEELRSRMKWEPRNKYEEDFIELGIYAKARKIQRAEVKE